MAETDHKSESFEVGATLSQAREARGASIDEISAILKIRVGHLQALENDDFEALPADVYGIGFLRTYATHLGLNAGDLIQQYKEMTAGVEKEDLPYDPQTERQQVSIAAKIAIAVVVVFAVYIIWLVAGGASAPDKVASSSPAAPGIASPAKPAPVKVETPTVAKAVPPTGGKTDAPQTVVKKREPKVEPKSDIKADPLRTPAVVEADPIAALESQAPVTKIEIRAIRRTWLRIENAQGQVLLSSIVTDGDRFELVQEGPYTLATRDAGALQYVVDGQAVGTVGRRSQILTARQIDRSSIQTLKP